MKAIGYFKNGPITAPQALVDIELPEPTPGPHDLLVDVRAVSVNPVDVKVRANSAPPAGAAKVLGWDASGVVVGTGTAVTGFAVGDEVWYSGAIDRPGSNAERHLVDYRIAARKPASLDFAAAAALPLTAITAWELLFDRLGVPRSRPRGTGSASDTLLIVGAAGGVGSILTQLAATQTELTVVSTASRPESVEWVRSLGAHHVIDHNQPMSEQFAHLDIRPPRYVASLTHTDTHFKALIELLAPQGRLGLIDDPGALDVRTLKSKAASLHWEFMFTRPLYGTPDMIEQQHLLTAVAALIDDGTLKSTLRDTVGAMNAANLTKAHSLIETGRTIGKVVLSGFA